VNWIDVILLGYLFLGALYGLRRGLVWVGFSLIGFVVGLLVAERTNKSVTRLIVGAVPIRRWVNHYLPSPVTAISGARSQAWHLAHAAVGLVVFLLVVGGFELAGRLVGSMASRGVRVFRVTRFVNKLGGLVIGIVEHGVVAGLVLTLLLAVPALNHSDFSRMLRHASVAGTLLGAFRHLGKIPGSQYL
jgi:uncharacterized membrane protein required for colicin V production